MINYKEMGARIKRERISRGMTQSTIARSAGISLSFYGHIERGTRVMSIDTLCKICEALNADVHYILWGNSSPSFSRSGPELNAHDRAIVSNYLTGLIRNLN